MTTIFYSWQSDLPAKYNRNLIEDALEKGIKEVTRDTELNISPVLDRDTANVPGAPDIAQTIFDKIEKSGIFVCDVTFVASSKVRAIPNPNVLVELGYAARVLGWDRMVLVLNLAYGPIESLPFDIRRRRVVTYKISEGEPGPSRASLAKSLSGAISSILRSASKPPVLDPEKAPTMSFTRSSTTRNVDRRIEWSFTIGNEGRCNLQVTKITWHARLPNAQPWDVDHSIPSARPIILKPNEQTTVRFHMDKPAAFVGTPYASILLMDFEQQFQISATVEAVSLPYRVKTKEMFTLQGAPLHEPKVVE